MPFTLTSALGTYYKIASRQNPRKASCWTHMADKDDILLNSREVAFMLDLSPDTVNEFARRNIIPAFKKGPQWRFRKRDITSVKRHPRPLTPPPSPDPPHPPSSHRSPQPYPPPRHL